MVKASDIIKQAQSWLGRKETDGSHREIIDVYNSHTPLARGYRMKYTDAWCSTFVSAVSIKCGATDIIPTECGCEQHINLFKKMGCFIEDESVTPKPGWIIFYDWQDNGIGDNRGYSDHIGIVEKVENGKITIIEGNCSDMVKRTTFAVNGKFIRGYGVPKYEEETFIAPAPTTTPTPQPTTNTSSNSKKGIIKKGQQHAIDFTGVRIQVDGIVGNETKMMKARVLQHAMNLDYGKTIDEDGYFQTKSKAKLGNHYVEKGEKQYMVTALEILMELNGIDPNGVEYPGIYGNGLVSASKQFFGDDGIRVTASEFLKLVQ